MKLNREPTYVTRVEEAMREADDLRTKQALMKATGLNNEQVHTALALMQRVRAADNVFGVSEHGVGLHWFLTPSTDTRSRRFKEIQHGLKRKRKVKETKK